MCRHQICIPDVDVIHLYFAVASTGSGYREIYGAVPADVYVYVGFWEELSITLSLLKSHFHADIPEPVEESVNITVREEGPDSGVPVNAATGADGDADTEI